MGKITDLFENAVKVTEMHLALGLLFCGGTKCNKCPTLSLCQYLNFGELPNGDKLQGPITFLEPQMNEGQGHLERAQRESENACPIVFNSRNCQSCGMIGEHSDCPKSEFEVVKVEYDDSQGYANEYGDEPGPFDFDDEDMEEF